MGIKIFISCSTDDHLIITKLKEELSRCDYDIVSIFDYPIKSNITPDVNEFIKNEINEANAVLAIVTANFLNSLNCSLEMMTALRINKRIVPIVIGDTIVPYYMSHLLYHRQGDGETLAQTALIALSEINNNANHNTVEHNEKDRAKIDNLEEVISALNRALADNQLTLVCGAGVSIPSHIPVWNDLLLSMVDYEIFDGKNSQNPNEKSAEKLISKMHMSSIILGKYLRLISGSNFNQTVRRSIYRDIQFFDDYSGSYADTKLMDAIVELARPKRRGKQLDSIITFNFDDIIETKMKKSKIDHCSIWKEGQSHDVNAIPIYHVHGFLPYNGELDEPNLVFDEEAYHSQFIDPYSWSNLLQLNTFSNNICLFVGLSLSDPNLRRLLDISWRRNKRMKHYIIMKRTSPDEMTDDNQEEHIEDIANMLFEQDANSLGLNVIWCNDYDEIPEILRKIAK